MNEDEVLAFASGFARSLWSLELVILLKSQADRAWSRDELIVELRSSETVVAEALADLRATRLVAHSEAGTWQYAPATPQLAAAVADLEELYRTKPAAVIRAVALAPNPKLRILSDAFRITDRK